MGISIRTFQFIDDGSQIVAANSLEFVAQLRDRGWFTQEESIEEYMYGFASRTFIDSEKRVRFEDTDLFLEDLLRLELIRELKCQGSCLPHGIRDVSNGWETKVYCGGCGRLMEIRQIPTE